MNLKKKMNIKIFLKSGNVIRVKYLKKCDIKVNHEGKLISILTEWHDQVDMHNSGWPVFLDIESVVCVAKDC